MTNLSFLANMIPRLSMSTSSLPVLANGGVSSSFLTVVRYASKKAGGSSKNPPGRPRGKHRGIKKLDSTWVTRGTILVRQRGLEYHPGLNVGLGRDRTLYALEPGVVVMTTEKCNPNWLHPEIARFYAEYKEEEIPIYKTYFHIIPDPQHQNFRLVDLV
ncbi:60S ribosomal protein L27, mitochondrial [Halocaridina rubra]|uniref:Large ribosomal subunit protein bL27m n=1 Tax=Halocaridina rubra TaxID=373956 RepID=A0AAN9ABC7_HALRR